MFIPTYLPVLTVSVLGIFIYTRRFILKHGVPTSAALLCRLHNRSYALFSLFHCISIFAVLIRDIRVMANDGQASFDEYLCIAGAGDDKLTAGLMDMYYWSKIYENLDVFLVLLSGGTIGEYFAFHHLTTPYITYVRTIMYPSGWAIVAFLNTLHHTFMYANFGGYTVFSSVLSYTGAVQLLVGVLGAGYILWENQHLKNGNDVCGGRDAVWANWITIGVMGIYGVLFLRMLGSRGEKKKVVGEVGVEEKDK